MSGYNDLVQRGVRLKSQRSALLRGLGLDKRELQIEGDYESFILEKIDKAIQEYEQDKEEYTKKLTGVVKQSKTISGVGLIGSIKIASIVISADRFISRNHFLSYCGLVRLERLSGGRSYGSKRPRHRRDLKAVFKTAALSCITHEGDFRDYYEYLINKKNYPTFQARHAVARKIAVASLGVMKSGEKYKPEKLGAIRELKK